MSQPKPITFEEGYRRLQQIAEEVNETEVPVDRMADLFAEGKGLDKALTDHLAEQRARIDRIERGEDIQAFRVVAPGAPPADEQVFDGAGQIDVAASDRETAPAAKTGDDDIPF